MSPLLRGRSPTLARWLSVGWLLLAALLLQGCQSDGGMDGLEIGPQPPAAVETVGTGPIRIAVLLPADAAGAEAARNAARLAVEDLGADAVTASLVAGYPAGMTGPQLIAAAKTLGAVAAIGPPSAARTPFALAAGPVYDVRLDEADSAAAGVVGAAASGPASVVLLVADTPRAGEIEKLVGDRVAVFGGKVVASARFADDAASVDAALARIAAAGATPDIVLVTAGRASPASVIAAVKARGIGKRATRFVGTDAWTADARRDKSAEGVMIATLDHNEMAPMAERFRKAYGREPDHEAAYVYDLVALCVGLARAVGAAGFDRRVIEGEKGFRGSTGVFRFRADGGSERLLAQYALRGGSLRQVHKALPSF